MLAVVMAGGLGMFPQLDIRVKGVMALVLATAALPMATAVAPPPHPALLPMVGGEAIVGVALGLVVALVFSAASWAGGIVASVAGLSWADDFTPDGNSTGDGGGARLAGWLAVAGFLAAGGHLAVISGLVDSVGRFPVGHVATGDFGGLSDVVLTMPAAAMELAWALALPFLAAVLTFHVAIALCLRSVRFTAGQGIVQAAASIVLLAAIMQGATTWTEGFATAARATFERGFFDIRP
jgi:flagellar biosynthetic protein FliR